MLAVGSEWRALPPRAKLRAGCGPVRALRVGRYEILARIGAGGMATVELARAIGPAGFRKWVALKRLHQHLAAQTDAVAMFLDEARIGGRLVHPNLTPVFELGRDRDGYWMAMEYLHGEPLRELMRAAEEDPALRLPLPLAAALVARAADGLHAAHELRGETGEPLGLVHRDVTPHNVFVTYSGAVKVVDFGVARLERSACVTQTGVLKGKPAYMSPEQARGEALDRRTDVFALGVLLWELTTGQRLFRAENEFETLRRVRSGCVPPASALVPGYPGALEAALRQALAVDPARRFRTAGELARALDAFVWSGGAPVGAHELSSHLTRALPGRREKADAWLGAAARYGEPECGRRWVVVPATMTPGSEASASAPVGPHSATARHRSSVASPPRARGSATSLALATAAGGVLLAALGLALAGL